MNEQQYVYGNIGFPTLLIEKVTRLVDTKSMQFASVVWS